MMINKAICIQGFFLSLLLVLSSSLTAEIYRYKNAQGQWVYTDEPASGEVVELPNNIVVVPTSTKQVSTELPDFIQDRIEDVQEANQAFEEEQKEQSEQDKKCDKLRKELDEVAGKWRRSASASYKNKYYAQRKALQEQIWDECK